MVSGNKDLKYHKLISVTN